MSKLQNNQDGFSIIEGLLVIIAVTLVVGVGAYVLNSNKNEQPAAVIAKTITSSATTTPKTVASADDKLTLSDPALGFTAKYPKDWKLETPSSQNSQSFLLSSPDVVISDYPIGGIYVTAGAQIAVSNYVLSRVTTVAQLKDYYINAKHTPAYKNLTDIKVGGKEALQLDFGYESPDSRMINFFVGSKVHSVTIQNDVYAKSEYAKIFNDFISSIAFK
jgi:hypothetical protein